MRVWDAFLTPSDKEVFRASGTGTTLGIGDRPVLLVVDVTYAYTGDVSEPILDSIRKWPNSCGPRAWEAIPHIQSLLSAFRAKGFPVFYSATPKPSQDGFGRGLWRSSRTDPTTTVLGVDASEIVHDIAPEDRDIVITKVAPSAFFGTYLSSYLASLRADSVIVCGATTSGCVRASVVDGFSHNLRMIVAEEATFDRGEASHAVGLFDLDAKYADVLPTAQVVDQIASMSADLYRGVFGTSSGGRESRFPEIDRG
jgi:nicotinamidase-related amidase